MSQAYADPDCPDCGGMGFIYGASMLDGGRSCHCMMDALRLQNMEKVWSSLPRAREIENLRKDPPLKLILKRNAWITAPRVFFRAHLKALAYSLDPMWDARVFTDLDIVETWLKTAKAQGHKIYDSEVDNHENDFIAMDIGELVTSYELVIFMLGVKQAPNKETHSTLLEALAIRQHLGKPTWIVDAPDQPILDEFHKAYSKKLENLLQHWLHIRLVGPKAMVEQMATEWDYDPVGDVSAADRLLDVPPDAEAAVTEALSDFGELGDDPEVLEDGPPKPKRNKLKAKPEDEEDASGQDEEDASGEEYEEEYEEDEPAEDLNPMLQQLLKNEQRAAEKERKKQFRPKPRSFGKKGKG